MKGNTQFEITYPFGSRKFSECNARRLVMCARFCMCLY